MGIKQAAMDKATGFFREFESSVSPARDIYEPTWETNLSYYQSEEMNPHIVGANLLFVPKTKALVDVWVATNMANPPKTKAIPRNETSMTFASNVSQLESYAYSQPSCRRALWDVGWSTAVYGTGIGFISWRLKKKKIRVRETVEVPELNIEQQEVLETERVVEDFPSLEYVNLYDFWPDPKGVYADEFRFAYRKRVYSDEVSLNMYLDFFDAKLPPDVRYKDLSNQSQTSSAYSSVSQSTTVGRFYDYDLDEVTVLERWNSDGTLQIVVGQYMVYDGPSPFDHGEIPFAVCTINRNADEFYGKGIPEIYRPIQEALNKEVNTTLDNLEISSYPMVITKTNSRLSAYASIFELGPGAIIEDDDPAGVQQLRLQSVSYDHFNMFGMLERLGSEAVSISAPMMGQVAPGTSKTATGITALIDMGLAPARLTQVQFDVLFLRRVSRQFYYLFQQYMPEEYIFSIIDDSEGARVIKMERGMIASDFDFEPEAGSMNYIDKATQRQTWMSLLQIAGGIQQTMLQSSGKKIELDRVFAQLLDAFGIKNQKEFVVEDKQFLMQAKQMADEQQQQQQLQAMLGGQMGVPQQ